MHSLALLRLVLRELAQEGVAATSTSTTFVPAAVAAVVTVIAAVAVAAMFVVAVAAVLIEAMATVSGFGLSPPRPYGL